MALASPNALKTLRVPLVGAFQNRNGMADKDQRFINCFPESRKNDITETKKIYLYQRSGLNPINTVAGPSLLTKNVDGPVVVNVTFATVEVAATVTISVSAKKPDILFVSYIDLVWVTKLTATNCAFNWGAAITWFYFNSIWIVWIR